MPEPDRGSPRPELPRERERVRPDSRGTIFACIALLLMAAAPETPTSEVQKVPPEQALAVLGHMVADPEGKDIGRLVDVLVDREGQPQAGVIDFGGFLGVGSRKIAVRWNMLHFVPGDPKHQVTLNLTPDQIKAAPEFKDIAKPAPVVVAPPPQASGVGAEAPPSQPAADSANPGTAPPEPQPGSAEPQTQPQPK